MPSAAEASTDSTKPGGTDGDGVTVGSTAAGGGVEGKLLEGQLQIFLECTKGGFICKDLEGPWVRCS